MFSRVESSRINRSSQVLEFFHRQISVPKAGGYFEYKTQFLNQYPIRIIDFSNKQETQTHDQIVHSVEQLLQLNKDLQVATLESKKEQLKTKIEYFEDKINALVYGLYELTEEEIKIVENVK